MLFNLCILTCYAIYLQFSINLIIVFSTFLCLPLFPYQSTPLQNLLSTIPTAHVKYDASSWDARRLASILLYSICMKLIRESNARAFRHHFNAISWYYDKKPGSDVFKQELQNPFGCSSHNPENQLFLAGHEVAPFCGTFVYTGKIFHFVKKFCLSSNEGTPFVIF